MEQWIFISYRRDDSAQEARLVRDAIAGEFGEGAAFFDTDSRVGEIWPAAIRDALKRSTVVVMIIGPMWLTSADEWGRRRIDSQADWVRCEASSALAGGQRLIPVYVSGAKRPPRKALPAGLRPLVERQDIEIRRDFWDHDLCLLLAQLHQHEPRLESHDEIEENGPYPVMRTVPPGRIDDGTLERILTMQLASWMKIRSQSPEDPAQERLELYKEFKFSSFLDALRFMNEVAVGCEILDHHPRWENIYRTLRVYLTTWGIGHLVSDRDVQLARYFDEAYRRFARPSLPR